jgi:hypothetical protein
LREYILTPHERHIIEKYLETNEKLEGFKVILHRCRKQNPKIIQEDQQLIEQFLKKVGS